jgi:hypothetical protein
LLSSFFLPFTVTYGVGPFSLMYSLVI